jgi:uncharacterized membrane protein YfcA
MSMPTDRALRRFLIGSLAALGVMAALIVVHPGWRVDPDWHSAWRWLGNLPTWMVISAIIFLAATISSTVGFAFSAIAGSMILHYVPNGVEAVQIMMVASIGIQIYSVAGLSREISWSRCVPFILGGIALLPIGILLLLTLRPQSYVLMVGAALVLYGLYMLLRRPVLIVSSTRMADVLVGALGGISGPLAAIPGIPVTIWCGMRGWDKVAQRAVYQPYILVMQVIALASLLLLEHRGTFDPMLFAYALPGLAGAVVGLRAFHALTDSQFHRMINLALVASGAALVLKHLGDRVPAS